MTQPATTRIPDATPTRRPASSSPPPRASDRPAIRTRTPTWRHGRCLACHGKGTRAVYRPLGAGRYQRLRVPCPDCDGSGRPRLTSS